jgi:hypothetical protein
MSTWWSIMVQGVVATLVALATLGCGSGPRESGFSSGRGFGLSSAAPSHELHSAAWDVKLRELPDGAKVVEAPDSWTASSDTLARTKGQTFTFMVVRNDALGASNPRAVASMLRGEDRERGFDTSEIVDAEFLGHPGARYTSVPERGPTSITLLAVSKKCVYVLSVSHVDRSDLAGYFGQLVSRIGTMSGGPADAPACR